MIAYILCQLRRLGWAMLCGVVFTSFTLGVATADGMSLILPVILYAATLILCMGVLWSQEKEA